MNNIIVIVSIQRTASSKQGVLLTDKKKPTHTHAHTHTVWALGLQQQECMIHSLGRAGDRETWNQMENKWNYCVVLHLCRVSHLCCTFSTGHESLNVSPDLVQSCTWNCWSETICSSWVDLSSSVGVILGLLTKSLLPNCRLLLFWTS